MLMLTNTDEGRYQLIKTPMTGVGTLLRQQVSTIISGTDPAS